jgi:phenylpropionate dioxygenase-like ring-hydroxylating dioxygenase large terminal subunit
VTTEQIGWEYARRQSSRTDIKGLPTVQEVLANDQRIAPFRQIPEVMRETSTADMTLDTFDVGRYVDPEFHHRELEQVWRRVWQMACREQDIPMPGDHLIYEIGDSSLIIVRGDDGVIRALHNSCLHRGTLLRPEGGSVSEFRCRVHGFCWSREGRLAQIPSAWDFPHIDQNDFDLPQARVDTWGGFVFICMAEDTEPLVSYLENLPEQFRDWPLEKRHKAIHVAKVIDCNWKVGLEAFLEAMHLVGTHPQSLPFFADEMSQYDVWPGIRHINRVITNVGLASPHLERKLTEQEIADALVAEVPTAGHEGPIKIKPGEKARTVVAAAVRRYLSRSTGIDFDQVTDSELLDPVQYLVFPNLVPWAGIGTPLVYRWRPYGNDPHRCVMDVMLLFALPDGSTPPRGCPVHWLGPHETFGDAQELRGLGALLDQDLFNLIEVQRGLRASRTRQVTFARYQESRIRHFHHTLDDYLSNERGSQRTSTAH